MRKRMVLAIALAAVAAVQARADGALDSAVNAYAQAPGGGRTPPFKSARLDLNDDGNDDAIVLLTGPDWCGSGGCTMLVFKGVRDGLELVSSSSVALEPIRVLEQRSHGWAGLIVHSRGHGEALLRFDGKRYPRNPSTAPLASAAQVREATVAIDE